MPNNFLIGEWELTSGDENVYPEVLSPKERAYYRAAWGFDPVADKKVLPLRPHVSYYYETPIPLENDPELRTAGVTMHVRVDVDANGKSHNRIVLIRGEESVEVECVHTAVYAASVSEVSELPDGKLKELATAAGGQPAILPPWEHFVALKSFAAGIAAIGLLWLIDPISLSKLDIREYRSSPPTDIPFSFELIMQIQQGLVKIAPEFLGFDVVLALGNQQLNAGYALRAADYFQCAVRLNPASVDAWYGLGMAYHIHNDHQRAAPAFEMTVKLDPRHADAWFELSVDRKHNGDLAGAKAAMKRWDALDREKRGVPEIVFPPKKSELAIEEEFTDEGLEKIQQELKNLGSEVTGTDD